MEGNYREEVKNWIRTIPDGVTTDELLHRFPGCPIRAMESTNHITYKGGRWVVNSNQRENN